MAIEKLDSRFDVYAGLVRRAFSDKRIVNGTSYRVEGTDNEFELLCHGDEAVVDDIKWRITARNPEAGCFFLSGSIDIPIGDISIRCRPTDPIDRLRKEFSLWESAFHSRTRDVEIQVMRATMKTFFYHLVNDDQIMSYLNSPEAIKQSYREAGCGYGLPTFEPPGEFEV